MAKVNLTVKSRDKLKEDGFTLVETVERWNSFARVKNDLFGIIDVLAVGGGVTLAVQVTSRDNMSSRRKKITESPAYPELLEAGWRVELHGWYKEKNRWQVKLEVLGEDPRD
jgi:hypothetical protein